MTDPQPADAPKMRNDDPDTFAQERPREVPLDNADTLAGDTPGRDDRSDRADSHDPAILADPLAVDAHPDDQDAVLAAESIGDDHPDDNDRAVDSDAADEQVAHVAPTGSGRPPLIVIIASALLLVAIGAGLAVLFVPPASQPSAQSVATAGPAALAGTPNPADPALPTALPLPEAVGDVTSTDVIATVGDVNITRGEFVRAYQPGGDPIAILNQLIQVELVVQAAGTEGVQVDEAAVTAQLDTIKQENAAGDAAQFLTFLQQNNIPSEESLRALLRRDQLVEQMLLRHTTAEQAHGRHILLAATAEQVETRKTEAEALLKQIEDGGDFAALASEKSEDPGSKESGGDLGWAPRGLFVPEFDEALFSMKKDEVRLVQSQFGWHIIQLLDLPEVRGFDNRELLNTPPGQQAFAETFLPWVEQIKVEAEAAQKIKILATNDQLVKQPGS